MFGVSLCYRIGKIQLAGPGYHLGLDLGLENMFCMNSLKKTNG